jgi:hypothetical protein
MGPREHRWDLDAAASTWQPGDGSMPINGATVVVEAVGGSTGAFRGQHRKRWVPASGCRLRGREGAHLSDERPVERRPARVNDSSRPGLRAEP